MIGSRKTAHESVRSLAAKILYKVDTRKAYADILLNRALRRAAMDERDRALLTELTYGTLRWRGAIDARLQPHLRRRLDRLEPFVRNLLRLGAYQILYLDRVPNYAAVNEAVELAKANAGLGAAGFVNGVLRSLLRDRGSATGFASGNSVTSLADRYSHPIWLVQRWLEQFGPDEAEALMRANNERAPLTLRVNTLKCARDELLNRFLEAGIDAAVTPWSPAGIVVRSAGAVESLPGFVAGFFQVQGESSQLIGFLLSPSPGERILDACAAPGGKTTHLAELMQDHGEVIALDNSAAGVERILHNVKRLGLQSVRVVIGDATDTLSDQLAHLYDRILVDAPCSGLGTLRAHPEIKWHRRERDIVRLSGVQSNILRRMANYLRPGGILLYSTCTLTPEENERNVEAFLAEHGEFELEDAARYLPRQAQPMTEGSFFLALPHRHDTDGFFAARLRKSSR